MLHVTLVDALMKNVYLTTDPWLEVQSTYNSYQRTRADFLKVCLHSEHHSSDLRHTRFSFLVPPFFVAMSPMQTLEKTFIQEILRVLLC